MSSTAPATTEISFRLTAKDDGTVKVDSRYGSADAQGLTAGWSHMTTAEDGVGAAEACAEEIERQLIVAGADIYRPITVDDAYRDFVAAKEAFR